MASQSFKVDTEKFVRKALTSFMEKPSEKNIRQAVTRIVREFEPVIAGSHQRQTSGSSKRRIK